MQYLKFKETVICGHTLAVFYKDRSYQVLNENPEGYYIENHLGQTGYISKSDQGLKYEVIDKE